MKRMLNVLALIALFAACSVGGQFAVETARAAFWQWSKSSSTNGNSDPTISWIEGMPPSVVNDSGRAMMARLAEQAADTSGALTTAGGPVAYTVATNQVFSDPLPDGVVLGLTFNVDSGAGPTLALDGGAAHPIYSAPSTATTVSAGIPYSLLYRSGSGGYWLVRGGGGGGTPLGAIIPYSGSTEPGTSYKLANGQCISTTTYASYWALMGSPGNAYCAAGQFPVLDLRGRFIAGVDPGVSRMTANGYGCGVNFNVVGAVCNTHEYHYLTTGEMPSHSHGATSTDSGHSHSVTNVQNIVASEINPFGTQTGGGAFDKLVSPSAAFSIATGYASITTSITATGDGGPHSIIPPTMAVNYLIRVQ